MTVPSLDRTLPRAVAALAMAVLLVPPASARAAGARELVAQGNAAYQQGQYDKALDRYEEATVELPESPRLYFNRGAALYRQDDYPAAREAFREAALRARDPELTARAKYNLGNCAFREAQRQRDSDLAKAIEYSRESISHYQEARDLAPGFKEAAENIEIVRLYVKNLLDEQKKQQEQQQQDQDQQQNQDHQQQQQAGDDQQQQQPRDGEQPETDPSGDENEQEDGPRQQQENQEQENQQEQPSGEAEQEQPESRAAAARRDTAEEILDEEKENQKRMRPVIPRGVRPVERDW